MKYTINMLLDIACHSLKFMVNQAEKQTKAVIQIKCTIIVHFATGIFAELHVAKSIFNCNNLY